MAGLLYVRTGLVSLSHVHESVNHARADGFPTRQNFMAKMLAAHRTAVPEAAHKLRRAGIIDYRRGALTVPDRRTLGQADMRASSPVARRKSDCHDRSALTRRSAHRLIVSVALQT